MADESNELSFAEQLRKAAEDITSHTPASYQPSAAPPPVRPRGGQPSAASVPPLPLKKTAPPTPAPAEQAVPVAPPAQHATFPPHPPAPAPAQNATPAVTPVQDHTSGTTAVRRETQQDRHGGQVLDIVDLLEYVVEADGSDLHLSVNAPPLIRVSGGIQAIPGWGRLRNHELKEALYSILEDTQKDHFESEWELDFAYTISNGSRFRGNLMKQQNHVGAVFRVIPQKIKPLSALNMPPIVGSFAHLPRGLVLVTGPTGSGKSTTLAAIIDQINRTRAEHILTVEDPIEFVHQHRSCVVNQREVGRDTKEYNVALKHALRQDPDVILIGEMRDLETISIALTAAETGHLVFATLHTQSAKDTVSRVIDVFPAGQQQQVRSQLAATLRGVVCQTLLKRADGKGRVAATEIMIVNPAIANQIRRDELHTIPQALQTGEGLGMHSLNMNLADLVAEGTITKEEALKKTDDVKDLDNLLAGARGKKRRLQSADDKAFLQGLPLPGPNGEPPRPKG